MTNPIKRFFQILKEIVLFPLSFLQIRRAYQDMEKLRSIPDDPEERRKLLKKLGIDDEMMPFFEPMMSPQFQNEQMQEVDMSYLEDVDEEDGEDPEDSDE